MEQVSMHHAKCVYSMFYNRKRNRPIRIAILVKLTQDNIIFLGV